MTTKFARVSTRIARTGLVALLLLGPVVADAVPAAIPYSGYLTGEEGTPFDGTVKVEVALYAEAEGGQPVWGPCTYQVEVVDGYLSFLVGEKGTGLACKELAAEDLLPEGMYLEIALDDVLLSPRQWMGSVGYALQADNAQRLAGKSADQYVTGVALDSKGYVEKDELAAVALSGKYSDLDGKPDLAVYLKKDGSVGLAGDWDVGKHRLLNLAVDASIEVPAAPVPGQLWWDTQSKLLRVWTGTEWLALGGVPKDGLQAVSNGALTNKFEKEYAAVGLPTVIGESKDIPVTIGDKGTLLDIVVTVSLYHPVPGELQVWLLPPGDPLVVLVLVEEGEILESSFTKEFTLADELPGGGSLQTLVGRQQSGTWYLRVTDTKENNNEELGKVVEFKLRTTYLASTQVGLNGDGMVSGSLGVAGEVLTTGLKACGNDVCSQLTAYGSELTAHSSQLALLEAKLWCLENCDEWKLSDCQKRECNGVTKECKVVGAFPDGTVCQMGKGKCLSGACCVPETCESLDVQCGLVSDGCGGTLDCGQCQEGAVCVDNTCCVPETCETLGKECGNWPDGCGGYTGECGPCTNGHNCGNEGMCDGPCSLLDGEKCGGICCPKFPASGYTALCNSKGHCEYRKGGSPGWKECDAWIWIPAGSFWMGSPSGGEALPGYPGPKIAELGRNPDEKLHYVKLTHGFVMQVHEVMQGEWKEAFGWNPSKFKECEDKEGGDKCPVDSVSWYDACAFANWKSEQAGLEPCYLFSGVKCVNGVYVGSDYKECLKWGQGIDIATVTLAGGISKPYDCEGFRLSTEAEWEYAARAGSLTAFYPTEEKDGKITVTGCEPLDPNLGDIGWYCGNADKKTHPVGWKNSNPWGLKDVSGNVQEWCWDWYGSYPVATQAKPVVDPVGEGNVHRVHRGGSWKDEAKYCRSACRGKASPGSRVDNRGFRLVRTLGE